MALQTHACRGQHHGRIYEPGGLLPTIGQLHSPLDGSFAVPLQISVVAMVALAGWLIVNDRNFSSAPVGRTPTDASLCAAVCASPATEI